MVQECQAQYTEIVEALNNQSMSYPEHKKQKTWFCFSCIFNNLSAIKNGGISPCRRNSELIRVSLLYNSVITKTSIDARTNRIIGGQSPSRYLARLDRKIRNLDQVLLTYWLKPNLLRNDKFSESFVERGQAMFELINEAMGKQAVDGREAFRNALTSAGYVEIFDEDVDDYDAVGDAAYSDTDEDESEK